MTEPTPRPPLVVAITGASGAPYAIRLLECLLQGGYPVHLAISPSGQTVLFQELGLRVLLDQFSSSQLWLDADGQPWWARYDRGGTQADRSGVAVGIAPRFLPAARLAELAASHLRYHHYRDFMTPIASGSYRTSGMIICPCSGGTLSGVVSGASSNLIERAAEVHLKEHRKLVLVPRETPLSPVYLSNLRRAAEVGAVVLPAMPGWYHGVRGLLDLIDFIVARVLDQFDIPHTLMQRWGDAAC